MNSELAAACDSYYQSFIERAREAPDELAAISGTPAESLVEDEFNRAIVEHETLNAHMMYQHFSRTDLPSLDDACFAETDFGDCLSQLLAAWQRDRVSNE